MTHKILVEIEELNGHTHFKRCPVNDDGKVVIHTKGGAGNVNPPIPKAFWTRGRFFKKRYARYRIMTKRFMTHADDSSLPISLEEVQALLNKKAYNARFGDPEKSLISYLILAGIGLLFFFLVIVPRIG